MFDPVPAAPAFPASWARSVRSARQTLGVIATPSSNGFHLGPFFVHAYGLAYVLAVAVAVAAVTAVGRWETKGGSRELVYEGAAIRVYTVGMKVVKVRRVGNSNVISIPRKFEARGYGPGSSVLVEELQDGDLRIMSIEKVRERIRHIGGRLVAEHGEALEILANHDPDAHR